MSSSSSVSDGNVNLVKNLEFFSELTQKTLSDFHFTNSGESLTDEISELKQFIYSSGKKKVRKIKDFNEEKYVVYFTDHSEDIIPKKDIYKLVEYKVNPEYSIISTALKRKPTPITGIRMSKNIECVTNKGIVSESERIFFLSSE